MLGSEAMSRWLVSKPSMPGIFAPTRARLGRSAPASSNASSADAASPTPSKPGVAFTTARVARRASSSWCTVMTPTPFIEAVAAGNRPGRSEAASFRYPI